MSLNAEPRNDRPTALILIAVALAGYGVYIATYVPGALFGHSVSLPLIGFVLQAVCAVAAAFGVWGGRRWDAGAVVLLGASIAATWLVEGFVLGIVAYLRAVLAAVLALVATLIIAAYLNRRGRSQIA